MLKQKRYRNRKILAHAMGQCCTMNLEGVCNYDQATTVAAHSGLPEDGKGMGMKGDDFAIAYMCFSCHGVYDGRIEPDLPFEREFLIAEFHKAMKKTLRILFTDGVIS
jgi:hypothetical protein